MSTNIANSLRRAVQAIVSQRGNADGSTPILETTLIRNGVFCGRRFSLAGFSLVWFQEEGQVKFYNPLGTLEQSCTVDHFCMTCLRPNAAELRRAG